ncbi:MAG TPA: extracellular solute-binding protein [Candidatus Paenibacillus intestinavium]|nr:extracellular solute-binding protein [Candidatus Paenibacillus intestinavium]
MRKIFSSLMVVILLTTVLAACGGNSAGTNTENTPGTGNGNKLEGKSVTLKVFIAQPRFKEQYDKLAEAFTEKVKVEKNIDLTIQLELPNSDSAPQILKTRLASNDAPDVFSLHAINEIPSFYKAGYLEDLSDQPFVATLMDNIKSAVTSDDGKVVALPLETLSWGYLYNKDIFAEHNLEVPTTLTEMKAVVDTLNAANVKPFLLSYKEAWIPQLLLPLSVGALIEAGNSDFIARMNNNEGSFSEMSEMFNIFDLINANGTDRALEIGGDDGAAKFGNGEAAMWLQGPWFAETILKSNENMNFGVAPLPINDDPNTTLINLSASTSLAVSKSSKNKEVAIDFINFIMSEEYSNELFQSLMFNPTSTVHTFESFPWVDDATVFVKEGKAYQDPAIPQVVKDEVGKGLQSYFAGQLTKEQVIDALDKAWQSFNKVNN